MKKMIGQPQYIKEVNIDIIESIIAEKGPISKPELSKITSLSLPTVNKVVDTLLSSSRIKTSEIVGSGLGRKAQFYVVNENSGYILALYFMNDSYICSVVNAIGEIVYKCTVPVDTSTKVSALKSTYKAIDDLLSHTKDNAKAIGIGVPGVVKETDIISNIPTIPEWEGIKLKEIIETKYKISTFVENDVKLTTVGFYHNELKQQYSDIVYIYLGKGMGSGIIVNKKLFKGFKSFSGELGYMLVERPSESDRKYIKTRGILEQKISELIQSLKRAEMQQEKEAVYSRLLELLSFSINNLVCILNPQVIVLSGEIVNKEFVDDLRGKVDLLINEEDMPIFMDDNCMTSGIFGIVNLCISNTSSKLQLVKGMGV